MKKPIKWTEELDEMVTNTLYRLHFPCNKKKCNCDMIIEIAKKYLESEVFNANW